MSEQMDRAVLTMPYELAMGDELSRMQFWSRVQLFYKEQAARIEADESLMRQAAHLLKRYVSETPLGHQPHEIALPAYELTKALRSRLETK